METIGYHTVKNKKVENVAVLPVDPFISNDPNAYLGNGYYFWDYNKSFAEKWGQIHYEGNFLICQAFLHLEKSILLDLVGNMEHIVKFRALMNEFHRDSWPIGKFIGYMRMLNKRQQFMGLFPYKAVRAMDYNKDNVKEYKFSKRTKDYTILEPVFIICLFEKTSLLLSDFTVVAQKDKGKEIEWMDN